MTDARPILLLDIDNTILDFSAAEAAAIRRAFADLGIEADDELIERYSGINLSQWERCERGLLTREQVLVRRFELLFAERGIEASPAEAAARYEDELCVGHWFMPGAEALLETLYGRCRLFIVSNGTAKVQAARLASAGIGPFFENIFISEQLGVNKPQRAFFERAFAQIPDFSPDRTLLVGDSLSSDILGAINCGVRGCWYNPKGRPGRADIRPDFEIRSLGELPALLASLFEQA